MPLTQETFNNIIDLLVISHQERTKAIFRDQYRDLPLKTEPNKNLYLYTNYIAALKSVYGEQQMPSVYKKAYLHCTTIIAHHNSAQRLNHHKTTLWTEHLDIHRVALQLNKDFKTSFPLPKHYAVKAHQTLKIKFIFEHHDAILKQIETQSSTSTGKAFIFMMMASVALGFDLHPGFFALASYGVARFFAKLNPELHIEKFSIEASNKDEPSPNAESHIEMTLSS